ncbi:type II toxin-antitoxin system RelE/ParE family toxin [Nitrospirillum amazonense]|uniref:Plasmid stabilization system protein ParE n=1 Tax=Nitrospirillum amazonense TaxID=28077 RepID=A0A560JUU2_9PROT|nr:type II toxin-antitoxin system RelE/ParE family toxin [Nitrospirillum amazonense]MDG3442221.1 type II toxin-antitoxin system RelE/ParE family toxin [Nitrospirillum amazonense]TWB73284.1 plasmid stabilization system protein ParE [Nitrospirillum amazonense]
MPRAFFHPLAEQDLKDITYFIAQDDVDRALAFAEELEAICQKRALFPAAGKACDHLLSGGRCFPYKNYIIYYRSVPKLNAIEILHILHGARDHERIMRDEHYGH